MSTKNTWRWRGAKLDSGQTRTEMHRKKCEFIISRFSSLLKRSSMKLVALDTVKFLCNAILHLHNIHLHMYYRHTCKFYPASNNNFYEAHQTFSVRMFNNINTLLLYFWWKETTKICDAQLPERINPEEQIIQKYQQLVEFRKQQLIHSKNQMFTAESTCYIQYMWQNNLNM